MVTVLYVEIMHTYVLNIHPAGGGSRRLRPLRSFQKLYVQVSLSQYPERCTQYSKESTSLCTRTGLVWQVLTGAVQTTLRRPVASILLRQENITILIWRRRLLYKTPLQDPFKFK